MKDLPGIRRRLTRSAPVICAIIMLALTSALAGFSGGSLFISPFDIIHAVPAGADMASEAKLPGGVSLAVEYDDAGCVRYALDALEKAFAFFPDGVFDNIELTVALCGRLDGYAGLTDAGGRRVSLDISKKSPSLTATAVHELCHAVDAELDRLAVSDPSHWNSEDWNALNPPGFGYSYSYFEYPGPEHTLEADPAAAYFVNNYAMISPYEDRAELMEAAALMGTNSLRSDKLYAKLEYYIKAIKYYLQN